MKFFDLFSGIGGIRLGFERNNHECTLSCEIDSNAREIYKKNFGSYPTYKDVKDIDEKTLPGFDILCAGFPCQSFSYAGKRLGFDDTRGSLFFEIARIVKEKRPKKLFLENVKGLLEPRTFTTIITTLYDLGYDLEWQIVNGKYFVPHNRERVFIIGHYRKFPFRRVFPIRESTENSPKPNKREIKPIKMIMLSHTKANIRQRIQDRYETWSLDSSSSKMGIVVEGDNNRRIRKLTVLEMERLMGFPDGWTEGVKSRYRLLGNSVIVPVVEFLSSYL